MKKEQEREKPEEHPAVAAARRNHALMAAVRESIAAFTSGEPGIPGSVLREELRRRDEQLQS